MKFRTYVLVTVTAGVCGYLAYQNVLSDEQRADVSEKVRGIVKGAARVADQVKPIVEGIMTPHVQDHTNRQRTERQWEALGY